MRKKNLSSFTALLLVVPGLAGESAEGSRDICSPGLCPNPQRHAAANGAGNRENMETAYGKLPLSFERNRGQTDAQVKFLSRGSGYTLFLTSNEAVLTLRNSQRAEDAAEKERGIEKAQQPKPQTPATVLRMQLLGGNRAPHVDGLDALPGKSHYFIGSDPKKWRTNVSHYARVRYREVYPGIDLIYYGNQRRLEYDFVVSPGADPKTIRLAFSGAEKLSLDDDGNLILRTERGDVIQQAPIVYQDVRGQRRSVSGEYLLRGENEVAFQVASYDRTGPLVIDPILSYSTYLGGSSRDSGSAIAVDGSGHAYVAGSTSSPDFPTTTSPQAPPAGGDVFVTKFDLNGHELIYSTYIGGNGVDTPEGIAVDRPGNAYVTGRTDSTDFPRKNAFQNSYGGDQDAFAMKLESDGSALVYSTYLGSSASDTGSAIAVDDSACAYVAGFTSGQDFPTGPWPCTKFTCPFQSANAGEDDAFVTKLNVRGDDLVYSTYLGGSKNEKADGIALDDSGNVYVVGETDSADFPTKNPLQASRGGIRDGFVSKLDDRGHALVFSTYFGGSNYERTRDIALDSSGNAYVAGATDSDDFPTTAGAFDRTYRGGTDIFVAKLSLAGDNLEYSTYLGGESLDAVKTMAVTASGNVHVTGYTESADFPTADAVQAQKAGGADAFVTKLNREGSRLLYSTYLGGGDSEYGQGIALDASGNAYVTGMTVSSDFPMAPRPCDPGRTCPFQPLYGGGGGDAYVTKIVDMPPGGFKILSIKATGENDIEITWTSQEGRTYRVLQQYDITLPYWYTRFTIEAKGGTTTWTQEGSRTVPMSFFEVGRVE